MPAMRFYMILLFMTSLTFFSCPRLLQDRPFDEYPVYSGSDLGVYWHPEYTSFRVYAPYASAVVVNFYDSGNGGSVKEKVKLKKGQEGTWVTTIHGDHHGVYYTFQTKYQGKWLAETPGIYAKAVGVNGNRAMITDFSRTNPPNWHMDKSPRMLSKNDVILYEVQIRDFSIADNSGMKNKGLYLAFTEENTVNTYGLTTGISHLKALGITHLHLLPAFDFRSIDESTGPPMPYNWGYDPLNYNAPEGSFASNPFCAETRIREFKQMVQALHKQGIRVILDVVYNHTGYTENSAFNLLVPGYYYRHTPSGEWSNASACGNETASERPMMQKFMIESLLWWMQEYHIDGFRFDLMGIHTLETMNAISRVLHQHNPSVFLYGEGWTAGSSPLPDSLLALKVNTPKLDCIAVFSDDLRDGIKGHWNSETDRGFISGASGMEESIKFGVVASCLHPQVNYRKVLYTDGPWSDDPAKTINYVTCHDNHTLADKLLLSCPTASPDEIKAMHKLANTIVMTSQGVPFLHAGVEFMRSKQGIHNSFESPDSINRIHWDLKSENRDMVSYYRDLIEFRKMHPAFKMPSAEMIRAHLHFFPSLPGVVSYVISGNANGDSAPNLAVIYNATRKSVPFSPGNGTWQVVFDKNGILKVPLMTQVKVLVPPLSALVLEEL